MFKIICSIGIILFFSNVTAQWRPEFKERFFTDTLYNLSTDTTFNNKKNLFHFPEYDFHRSKDLTVNWRKFPWQRLSDSIYVLKLPNFRLDDAIEAKSQLTFLFRIFSKNIQTLTFFIKTNDVLRSLAVNYTYDNYQIPRLYDVNTWNIVQKVLIDSGVKKDDNCILIKVKEPMQMFELQISELLLGLTKDFTLTSTHKTFSEVFNFSPLSQASYYDGKISEFIDHCPEELNDYKNQIGAISLVQIDQTFSEREAFDKILLKLLDNYIFYSEKKLQKKGTLLSFNRYMQASAASTPSFLAYAQNLAGLIKRTFEDPHFFISVPKVKKTERIVKCPIRLYEIKNKFLIAGIFDTIYNGLSVGDEVTKINGIPIGRLVQEQLQKTKPNLRNQSYLRATIVAGLLDRNKDDSLKLTTIGKQRYTTNTMIYFTRKLLIPQKFTPIHCEYKRLESDRLSYFRINLWDSPVYSKFVNNWEYIKNSQGLILDLRGNGGGDKYSVLQLFSIFLAKPTLFYKYKPIASTSFDSITVKPNSRFRFLSNKPVYILVDNSTACASEIFVMVMKQLPNVKVIGSSNTMGALASNVQINFPSGVAITTNSLSSTKYFDKYQSIEIVGIAPDKVVKIKDISDLRPYSDLVLNQSIRMFRTASRAGKL